MRNYSKNVISKLVAPYKPYAGLAIAIYVFLLLAVGTGALIHGIVNLIVINDGISTIEQFRLQAVILFSTNTAQWIAIAAGIPAFTILFLCLHFSWRFTGWALRRLGQYSGVFEIQPYIRGQYKKVIEAKLSKTMIGLFWPITTLLTIIYLKSHWPFRPSEMLGLLWIIFVLLPPYIFITQWCLSLRIRDTRRHKKYIDRYLFSDKSFRNAGRSFFKVYITTMLIVAAVLPLNMNQFQKVSDLIVAVPSLSISFACQTQRAGRHHSPICGKYRDLSLEKRMKESRNLLDGPAGIFIQMPKLYYSAGGVNNQFNRKVFLFLTWIMAWLVIGPLILKACVVDGGIKTLHRVARTLIEGAVLTAALELPMRFILQVSLFKEIGLVSVFLAIVAAIMHFEVSGHRG